VQTPEADLINKGVWIEIVPNYSSNSTDIGALFCLQENPRIKFVVRRVFLINAGCMRVKVLSLVIDT